jgi:hypothetical protein
MTDDIEQRLAEIEARANGATGGPWLRDTCSVITRALATRRHVDGGTYGVICDTGEDDDCTSLDFIAHSRTDIPWLIAQLREARKREHKLHEALEMLRDHQNGPPLPKYEEGWTKAMEMADEALGQEARDGICRERVQRIRCDRER